MSAPDFPGFLHARAAEDLADRLELVLRDFATGLLIADHPVDAGAIINRAGRIGTLIGAHTYDGLAAENPPQLVCDDETLPFADGSLDCLVLLLTVHTANDVPGVLAQAARALRPDGLLLAALLGGATLSELREAWLAAESRITGGASPRVAPFADIRDMGGLLQRAGLALPVTDVDRITVTYPNALALMHELKALGWSNPLAGRSRRPVTRRLLAAAAAEYENRFANEQGRVPATFEIIYLTGWSPHDSQPKPLRPGSARTRIADALSTEEHSLPAGDQLKPPATDE